MTGMRFCGLVYAVLYGYSVLFAVAQITDPSEVSALVAVMSRLIDPMNHLGNWNEGDPCLSNWTGVLCFDTIDKTDGYLHVQDLHLLNMNLSGSLAPELGQLSRLRYRHLLYGIMSAKIHYGYTELGIDRFINPETQRTGISKVVLAAIVVATASAVVITAAITFLMTRRRARNQRSLSRRRMSTKVSMKIDGVKGFKFKELALATDNFNRSTQVGQGGYGKVYKGILSDNTVVAIKRAEEGSLQGQKEFLTEIKLLSRLHHRNLVSLLGYCDEEEEQMLVYEFMPNGTLRDWLSGKAKACLNFGMRVRTALDSAKGILYLHTEANPPVFHRDIKASNILLDSQFIAKVADFGLSRLAPVLDDEGTMPTHVSTIVKGTPGYLDPEYFLTHKLTDKSDVYSLGVVLLELLTGMQPISHGKNIVREVNVARESGLMLSVIDNRMGSCPSECIERFVALALNCCHDKTERRPSMSDVVRELETILKMMPETDATFSESTSMHSGSKSTSASASSSFMTRDQYFSSYVSGSDLVSDVIPIIPPR